MPLPLTPRRLSARKEIASSKGSPIDIGQPTGSYDSHSVRERVRQWHAKGGGVVYAADLVLGPDEKSAADEEATKPRRKSRRLEQTNGDQTPPRQRTVEEEPRTTETHRRTRREKTAEPEAPPRPRSVSAPRRRIVSDEHWRANRPSEAQWKDRAAKRQTQPNWALPDDGIRVRPIEESVDPSYPRRKDKLPRKHRDDLNDDGIRVYSNEPASENGFQSLHDHENTVHPESETCTDDGLSFHSPTPSERHESGTRYSCDLALEEAMPSSDQKLGRSDERMISHNHQRKHHIGVRFAEPERPTKKSGKRLSKSGILSNVLEESKKILGLADSPQVREPRMPTIESWLDGTPDPFVDGTSAVIDPKLHRPGQPRIGENVSGSAIDSMAQFPAIRGASRDTKQVRDGPENPAGHSASTSVKGQPQAEIQSSPRGFDEGQQGNNDFYARSDANLPLSSTERPRNARKREESDVSLKRRGAYKKHTLSKTASRSNLTILKTAFSSVPNVSSSLLSSADSQLSARTRENNESPRTQSSRAVEIPASEKMLPTKDSIRKSKTFVTGSGPVMGSNDTANLSAEHSLSPREQTGLKSNDLHRSRSRITRHADLMTILSQPKDSIQRSIRSARSMRIGKSESEAPTITQIMKDIGIEEDKYMRELRTLVDGVIPVLLSSILSKSEAAITVGLFSSKRAKDDPNVTKPIYDMGIALERLKRAHKRLSLDGPEQLLTWAKSAQYIYWDYLQAWRMGFQDVVVNLAPADPSMEREVSSPSAANRELGRNESGDVVDSEGERVDVSFLLKRPLVRLRNLSRSINNIQKIQPSTTATQMNDKFQGLVDEARNRVNEERARLEDEAAAAIDATRARDPQTLGPLEGTVIDESRRVRARDCFNLTLHHTSCQVIDCRVELILREEQKDNSSGGDVLICEIDGTGRWLLFPPVSTECISARNGDRKGEIVVMLRGTDRVTPQWQELLCLFSDEEETGFEWVQMLGLVPVPSMVQRSRSFLERQSTQQRTVVASPAVENRTSLSASLLESTADNIDVPLGEHANRNSRHSSDMVDAQAHKLERARLQKAHPASRTASQDVDLDIQLPLRSRLPGNRNRSELSSNDDTMQINDPSENQQTRSSTSIAHGNGRPEKSLRDSMSKEISQPPGTQATTYPSSPARLQNADIPILPHPTNYQGQDSLNLKSRSADPKFGSPTKSKVRPNSPLKQEYEPSTASGSSSDSDTSSAQQNLSSASDSDDAEFEDGDVAMPLLPPGALNRFKSGPKANNAYYGSSGTIAPSESASQAPYKTVPLQPNAATKTIASIFYWSVKGTWESMHPDECSIVVTPGLIEAFEMSALHSKFPLNRPDTDFAQPSNPGTSAVAKPLVGLELTPLVPIRRGTALDISVRSPPTADSKIKNIQNANIMFRSRNPEECEALYSLINHARINNPTYIALQNARATSFARPFGGASFDTSGASRGSWFGFGGSGHRNSYRASSAPTPSAGRQSGGSSTGSAASALSALRRLGLRSSRFSIARSTITPRNGGSRASGSVFSSSEQSSSSGTSTPLPPGIAGAMGAIDGAGINSEGAAPIGLSNAKIRLYIRETASKWCDLGAARLTIMRPSITAANVNGDGESTAAVPAATTPDAPSSGAAAEPSLRAPGAYRPTASDKRVLVTSKKTGDTLLDVTLGESCFERVARTGIAVSVWETLLSDEGHVAKQGGVVGGKFRVYMLQMGSEAMAAYTFGIVGRFRY